MKESSSTPEDTETPDTKPDVDPAAGSPADPNAAHSPEPHQATTSNWRSRFALGKLQWFKLGLLAVLLVTAGVVAWMQFGSRLRPVAKQTTQESPSPSVSPTPSVSPSPLPTPEPYGGVLSAATRAAQLQTFTHPQTGESWLPEPKSLPDQHWYNLENEGQISYYEVGTRAGNTIIMADVADPWEYIHLYEKAPDGKVTAITHPDAFAKYYDDGASGPYPASVAINNKLRYDSLSIPRELSDQKGYILAAPSYPNLGELIGGAADSSLAMSYTAQQTLGLSTLQMGSVTSADTHLTSIIYYIATPIHTRIRLGYAPTEADLRSYIWSAGAKVSDESTLQPITRGCGTLNSAATQTSAYQDDDFQLAATSALGHKLYQLKDQAGSLFQKAYQEYVADAQSLDPKYTGLSAQQYQDQHGLLFHKDAYGRWLVYVNSNLRMTGGCAKPVVYLYPTTLEPVSVRVGAQVTVSDPAYDPLLGWNAWASPTGTVWVNGRPYPSLFWEGHGYGAYPTIRGGSVVSRADAPATIRQQLAAQGLRGREIDDFMQYWEPKLPTSPYMRLTWFNTDQMNQLAPLSVAPRPDTTIRVFLDFEGLSAPIDLPAQTFTAPDRRGFTLVEWGGLANFPLKP